MATDPELGEKIHKHLVVLGLETPMEKNPEAPLLVDGVPLNKFDSIKHCHHLTMRSLGLDLNDDSLRDTPKRIAKMYCNEIFTGLDYANFPKATTVENKMQYNEMVCVSGITVQSMCEHHFLPFVGTASVAYIPDKLVLGLSKFNRVVEFFSRRPQIQERLTEQISAALRFILQTEDVAVVINADHYCVKLRGIRDGCSNTVTSRLAGKFRTVPELRAEFLALSRT